MTDEQFAKVLNISRSHLSRLRLQERLNYMFTKNDASWIEYLEIDEVTRKRKLRVGIPQEIRDQYEKYINQYNENVARSK